MDAITASDYNGLASVVAAMQKSQVKHGMISGAGLLTRTPLPTAAASGGLKVFVITGLATGRGLYECKECLFDATDWNAETNVQKFGAIGNTVEVFNTGENKSVVGSILVVGDFLLAFQHTDDEGNVRWIGFSPKYSWWHGGF